MTIHQDAELYAALLESGEKAAHTLRPGRHAWVQVAGGNVELNGTPLEAGDGAALTGEMLLGLAAATPAEVLLFDLA